MNDHGHHNNARNVTERIYISGVLKLLTPAHFGSGLVRGDALVDMSLLLDEEENLPLIPGTTIAGALRNYLRARLRGHLAKERPDSAITWLFGPTRESGETASRFQSLLIVDDALSHNAQTTLRDGVKIDPRSGTAYVDDTGGAKFDVELIEPGAAFQLNFELLLTEETTAEKVIPYLVAALQGFEDGSIRLGLRKRRGYGRCQVDGWQIRRYDLRNPRRLCDWLDSPTVQSADPGQARPIADLFAGPDGQKPAPVEDKRSYFDIRATFSLKGSSLLIRSGFGEADSGPDMVHLHSLDEDGKRVPVIPGTSWAGVLRHRALRIVNTIVQQAQDNQPIVDGMFGNMPKGRQTGTASRLVVDETRVTNGQSLYQTRVRIDRFTGGALETALFEQAPVYGKDGTEVDFHVRLLDAQPDEKGLLMLLLKDLWTQDLPVGGESSVGRGRLKGIGATIVDRQIPPQEEQASTSVTETVYTLQEDAPGLGLAPAQQQALQNYVDDLWRTLENSGEAQDG